MMTHVMLPAAPLYALSLLFLAVKLDGAAV